MGFLDKAKNAAKSTKLKGEIVLLDREIKAKKQKFGIALSDLLWDMEAKQKALRGSAGESTYLRQLQNEWGVAKADLQEIHGKMQEIQDKLATAKAEHLDNTEEQKEEKSVMDKAKSAGTAGKRQAKLQLLERELKSRKQQFGVDVYEIAAGLVSTRETAGAGGSTLSDSKDNAANSAKDAVSGSKNMSFVEKQFAKAAISTVSKQLAKVTVSDKDVEKCIGTVKTEVEAIQAKIDKKRGEIDQLGTKTETTTTTSTS